MKSYACIAVYRTSFLLICSPAFTMLFMLLKLTLHGFKKPSSHSKIVDPSAIPKSNWHLALNNFLYFSLLFLLFDSVADPDQGSVVFLTPGSEMGKNQDPDPG
jgi:hypothetical protein